MENTENTALAIQLTPFEQTKENLSALASDYKNMVVTRENLKEANEARLVLYRKRIEIQNVAKANRKTIKDFLKNNNDAIETELIETIEPTELALEAKIKAIKDAIAEEERFEQNRIQRHQDYLALIRSKTVEVTNSNDIDWLKTWFEEDDDEPCLEEFQEQYDQLLVTLKETAKNRLEMLEFQAKKKADEELKEKEALAAEQALQDVQVAEIAAMVDAEVAKMTFDADFEEQAKKVFKQTGEVEFKATPIQPLKTVPIGATSEVKEPILDDKQILHFINTKLVNLSQDLISIPCIGQKGVTHKDYLISMLNKLSEQTLKVVEKL
jgi:hypothetical protein